MDAIILTALLRAILTVTTVWNNVEIGDINPHPPLQIALWVTGCCPHPYLVLYSVQGLFLFLMIKPWFFSNLIYRITARVFMFVAEKKNGLGMSMTLRPRYLSAAAGAIKIVRQ